MCHAMKNNTLPTIDYKIKNISLMENKIHATELKNNDKIEAQLNPPEIYTAMFDFQKN